MSVIRDAGEREPGSARNMSAITANDACDACSTPALHINTTEIYSHSHVDDDDELLKYIWREYLHPKQYEWVLIAGYIMVFLVSLVGNALGKQVCSARVTHESALKMFYTKTNSLAFHFLSIVLPDHVLRMGSTFMFAHLADAQRMHILSVAFSWDQTRNLGVASACFTL